MRYLFIILALILFACTEDVCETTIYSSDWRWNMQDNEIRECSGFEIDPSSADVIMVKIRSDLEETYILYDYVLIENRIILIASDKFRTEDFNDPHLLRMNIKLITYDN